jgi:hypothetical protein
MRKGIVVAAAIAALILGAILSHVIERASASTK